MNNELGRNKTIIRAALATVSDQRIADAFAWARDGKMHYWVPCGCLIGVLSTPATDALHRKCHKVHYSPAAALMEDVERAYYELGTGDDQRLRQRRIVPILAAELRRRIRAQQKQAAEVQAEFAKLVSIAGAQLERKDYQEACLIARGKSMMLPELRHIVAIYKKLECEEDQRERDDDLQHDYEHEMAYEAKASRE